ncbi:MAG: hypothetical protein COS14_11375 [Bacteroidetes bacterium CG02_land_8_20_14_3_00_31_25]|nr:MAG: hypothetical protein COS14_11375 [Bacteroidetes bacterium CG02_land_8_20_14_3_00_31_25]PIX33972.1 MAG: hypothetical protein COZ59_08690 [Bacteroidetes bacterium CG_4_8_14_3_um_filter_31_14]PIY02648.1 MAG: hypothetical protein COZ21_13075 [Bacteroidetes bacterium CG_4_10_14_3_um_filter_31_20]
MTTKKTKTKAKPKTVKTVKKTIKKTAVRVTNEDIAKRAYEIYLETGNNNELENWKLAEKELSKELSKKEFEKTLDSSL